GQKEQWRRETERPIIAALLTTSDGCLRAWDETAAYRQEWAQARQKAEVESIQKEAHDQMVKAAAEAWALHEKLRLIVAELDLIAGMDVRAAAEDLEKRHE